MAYEIETFPVGSFQCNCSILFDPGTLQAIVIDPGDELDKIIQRLEFHKLSLKALWHSHAHIDHVGATKGLFELTAAKNHEEGLPPPKVYFAPR